MRAGSQLHVVACFSSTGSGRGVFLKIFDILSPYGALVIPGRKGLISGSELNEGLMLAIEWRVILRFP